jgi:hypothetical protein
MTVPHRYATARALHDAIKVRAANEAKLGRYDINQIRRHFAYDRFLTRLFLDPDSIWILKGGTGLLARVPQQARHTQDIDLHYRGEIERAQTELDAAADRDLGDFFSFDLEQTGRLAGTTSGRKYRVVAYIGDAKFADFQIDAVVDSNMTGVPDHAPGLRPIDIDGLTTADYRIYPVVDHLADKLVAMTSTFASNRPSTRYRDLVDIVLIAQTQTIDADALRAAVESETIHRNHSLPERLKLPDSSWTRGYAAIAQTVAGLDAQDATDALAIAVSLYRPVFENLIDGTWDPSTMQWSESGRRA